MGQPQDVDPGPAQRTNPNFWITGQKQTDTVPKAGSGSTLNPAKRPDSTWFHKPVTNMNLLTGTPAITTNNVVLASDRAIGRPLIVRLKPRDYQSTIINGISSEWRQDRHKVLVSSPCGSGKTEISIAMAERATANGKPTLFVCDRIAIIQQTIKRFIKAGLDVGILWRELTRNLDAPVLIASSQTIQSRGIESIGDRFLVAIDEAHIDRAMSAQIVDHVVGNGGFAVGLTGTPLGAGIAGRWDAMVSGPTTYELAKLGYAVVPELIQRWRPDDADLEKVEIDNDGEYSAGSAGELMSRFAEMIAADIEKWLGEQGLNELPPAILFGATKANVEHQLKALKRRGITSATIFDTTKRRDRKNRIRAFEDGRVQLLGSVSALSVGFDCPKAMLMIGLRPLRRSITEFMQSAGRVARAADDKPRAWVLDYTGTVDLMGEYTTDRWKTGWSTLPAKAPKRRKKRWKCKCGHENHSDRRVCETCNQPKPVGQSPFPLPECRRCNPPTIQKPGATVCRRCHRPMPPGSTEICPAHHIPLTVVMGKQNAKGEQEHRYYCAHPGCEFISEAELAVMQQEYGDGLPVFRGSNIKNKDGLAWVKANEDTVEASDAEGRPVWIRGEVFNITEVHGKIFEAKSGDRIFKATIERPRAK